MGEVEAVEPALAGQAVRDPGQDLARDHARVAARAHQRAEAGRLGDPLGVRVGPGPIGLLQRRPDRRQHVRAGVAVGDREHVQRVDLVDVRLEARDGAPERREEPGAVARPAGHQATSVPLPARSEVRGSCVAGAGWATGAWPGLVAEVPDADRDAVRLAAQRVHDRVAHRGLDLARDLGDRQAVGDVEVEVDRQRLADLEPQPGMGDAQPLQQPSQGAAAGEARDAVRGQRRRAHQVADRAPGDQRSTGRGIGGHVGDVPPRVPTGRVPLPDLRAAGPGACATIPARSCWTRVPRGLVTARSEEPTRPWLAAAPSVARRRWAASTRSRRG